MIRNFSALLLIALSMTIGFTSCTSDDEDLPPEPITDFNYFPDTVSDEWDYEVATGTTSSMEKIEVVENNGSTFRVATDVSVPAGIMTSILTGGRLNKTDGKLLGTGSAVFDFQGFQNLTIDITDAPLYDQNMRNGTELYSTTTTDTQRIDNIDIDIIYRVSTVQLEDVPSRTVNGTSYENVIHTQLIIAADVSTEIGIAGLTQRVPILPNQNIIVVDNYWAEDIGLIESNNQFAYSLSAGLGPLLPNLGLPQSANILTTQNLVGFTVN